MKSKTVLVTRRPEQARALASAIEERGGQVMFAPMIEIADPPSWEECDRALDNLSAYDALVFASANAVEKFLSRCEERRIGNALLQGCLLFAVGPATAQALLAKGLVPQELPDAYSASGLLKSFAQREMEGLRILLPRGVEGRQELMEGLRRLGAAVDPVTVYSTVAPDSSAAARVADALKGTQIDAVTFASPSAVRNFLSLLPPDLVPRVLADLPAIAIGPTTAKALRGCGWNRVVVARTASAAGMADATADYFLMETKHE